MFPAVSGLARAVDELARGQLGQYLAGLWHTNFIHWLRYKLGQCIRMVVQQNVGEQVRTQKESRKQLDSNSKLAHSREVFSRL